MARIAQLRIPGENYGQNNNQLTAPAGIPSTLTGDYEASGVPVIQTGLSLLFILAVAIALIVLMWSGIQWITSGGDALKLKAAKARLVYAIVGLVIVMLSFFIVRIIATLLNVSPPGIS